MCDHSAGWVVIPANLRLFIPWKIMGGGGCLWRTWGEGGFSYGFGMTSYKIMHNCPWACLSVQGNKLLCYRTMTWGQAGGEEGSEMT